MINYIELGIGLHEHLASEGVFLEQLQSGEWQANASDERVNNLIASYNPWAAEKAKKVKEVNEWFSAKVSAVTADVTQEEKDSWPTQASEANGLEPINLLQTMADARGIAVEQMIEKVKRKQALYKQVYGKLQGEKDRVLDLVKALPNNGELNRLPELWALKCTG